MFQTRNAIAVGNIPKNIIPTSSGVDKRNVNPKIGVVSIKNNNPNRFNKFVFCFGLLAEGLGVNAQNPKLLIILHSSVSQYLYQIPLCKNL